KDTMRSTTTARRIAGRVGRRNSALAARRSRAAGYRTSSPSELGLERMYERLTSSIATHSRGRLPFDQQEAGGHQVEPVSQAPTVHGGAAFTALGLYAVDLRRSAPNVRLAHV